MAIKNLTAPKTFVAGGTITENQLVKLHTTSFQVVAAGAGDRAIGVAQHAAASGEEVSVEMTIGAIVKVVASAAITLNDRLEPAAGGTVATVSGAAQSIGFALEAATAENDIISMLLVPENVTIEDILTGLTASVAELNLIDGSVAGTAVASKALALGANKNVDVLAVADLKLGAAAGTSVTATAAELNLLSGIGAVIPSAAAAEAVINDPAGGGTVDAESRTAINAIIDALQAFGIVATS